MGRIPDEDDLPVVTGTPHGLDLRARLAEALNQELPVPSLSAFYKVSLVFMLGVALVLPLFYLMLPVALCAGGVVFLVAALPTVRGVYSLVFVVGAGMGMLVAAASMVAPLFQRWKEGPRDRVVVGKSQEPLLHFWVEKCAAMVGARMPDEIELIADANAAVRFDGGKVVLQLGVPLLAVLNVTEATGVLAHELGHVRQGWARRTFLSLMKVGNWFGDVIIAEQHRDHGEGTMEVVRGLALLLAMLVMRVLMAVADALALIMAREMELDADRYEAMLVGPQAFASTAEKISAAAVVLAEAVEKAEEGGACPDNLARWAQFHVERMPQPQRRRLARLLTRDAQGAPHPPFEDRVENARATARQGVMHVDGPATDLLRSFDNVARHVTLQGQPGLRFLPVAQLLPPQG